MTPIKNRTACGETTASAESRILWNAQVFRNGFCGTPRKWSSTHDNITQVFRNVTDPIDHTCTRGRGAAPQSILSSASCMGLGIGVVSFGPSCRLLLFRVRGVPHMRWFRVSKLLVRACWLYFFARRVFLVLLRVRWFRFICPWFGASCW